MYRTCKKCGRNLPLDAFYFYNDYLDKTCKDCRKARIRERYAVNSANPDYMERERTRGREKYHRLYAGKRTIARGNKEKMYPSLRNARRDFHIAPSMDIELHHWNYNNNDSVFALERRLHRRLHKSIKLNLEEGIYYYGEDRLDSESKHLEVINRVCDEYGFDKTRVRLLKK